MVYRVAPVVLNMKKKSFFFEHEKKKSFFNVFRVAPGALPLTIKAANLSANTYVCPQATY
jgi:hypothetical protein